MPAHKRVLTKIEKSKIIDLIMKGFSATSISQKMKMKNSTLKELCQNNNINLPKNNKFNHIKNNTDGMYKINNKLIYFSNMEQLYFLIMIDTHWKIQNISNYENGYKITKDDKIEIIQPKNDKATIDMIKLSVEKNKIKFMKSYYNKKFNIN